MLIYLYVPMAGEETSVQIYFEIWDLANNRQSTNIVDSFDISVYFKNIYSFRVVYYYNVY